MEETKDKIPKVQPKIDQKTGQYIYPTDEDITHCQRCGKKNVIHKPGAKYKKKYCVDCLKQAKLQNLTKARKVQHDQEREAALTDSEKVLSPSGDTVLLRDKKEKQYYMLRLQSYKEDYDLENSADKSLLSRLLTLELECKRIEEEMFTKTSQKKSASYLKLSDEIRKIQNDLSINRSSRLGRQKDTTVDQKIREVLDKFRKYKKTNEDRFVYKCAHCGEKNIINREKHDDDIITKEE